MQMRLGQSGSLIPHPNRGDWQQKTHIKRVVRHGGDMPDALQGGNATIYLFPSVGGTRWLAVLVGHQLPLKILLGVCG
jgi:hypothetical protein